jgi:hypothetical protein
VCDDMVAVGRSYMIVYRERELDGLFWGCYG